MPCRSLSRGHPGLRKEIGEGLTLFWRIRSTGDHEVAVTVVLMNTLRGESQVADMDARFQCPIESKRTGPRFPSSADGEAASHSMTATSTRIDCCTDMLAHSRSGTDCGAIVGGRCGRPQARDRHHGRADGSRPGRREQS